MGGGIDRAWNPFHVRFVSFHARSYNVPTLLIIQDLRFAKTTHALE